MLNHLPYLLCHGSGNRFVLWDALRHPEIEACDLAALSRRASALFRSDGTLLLTRFGEGYAMRMFNTDGSEAQMCGNGIRCVARLARERYLPKEEFILYSGGRPHTIRHEEPLFGHIPTYGVEIAIRLRGSDFPHGGERFLGCRLEALHPTLRFSYLNLGNPHLVAQVEEIDFDLLERLGEQIKEERGLFPEGINLSMMRSDAPGRIFVATYERGVGLTNSCGTAMTASTTAAVLLGLQPEGEPIEVYNRGGMVRCVCRIRGEQIATRLIGNATFYEEGVLSTEGEEIAILEQKVRSEEVAEYEAFVRSLTK